MPSSPQPAPPEAQALIDRLGLVPHPEGGWYRENWRDVAADGGRGSGTAIYYLLIEGVRSEWHRVDAAEVWHHYAGDPLELAIADGEHHQVVLLGSRPLADETPQAVVEPRAWQAARTTGSWSLVGCTVSSAYNFYCFDMAPPGWLPDGWTTPDW
jgi:predicted cupin superfamily sugar epimerase